MDLRVRRSRAPLGMRVRQLRPRYATTVRTFESLHEPITVFVAARVEAKHLLVEVGVEVERTRGDIRPRERALENAPKVFNAVRVNAARDVLHGMVDDVVDVLLAYVVIRTQRVGVDRRAGENVLANPRHERHCAAVGDNERANATTALDNPHDGSPTGLGARRFLPRLLTADVPALVSHLAADVRFVRFDLAGERVAVVGLHRESEPVQHKPRRLLRHADPARNLIGRNAVAVRRQQPHGREPLVEANRRVLKDRSDLHAELAVALAAAPRVAVLYRGHVGRSAPHTRARDTVREAHRHEEIVRDLLVRKTGYGLKERLWSGHRVHALTLREDCATIPAHLRQVYYVQHT